MLGWIADFFRFWWALFYWNARKGWFRLAGAQRDDCPCQNESDSGLAGETRCDAIVNWHHPQRFRRVCPLLVDTPEGLRCGVEAESVRPFWRRAGLYGAGLATTLYLGVTGLVYGALRFSEYDLSYTTIACPMRWPEIRVAREKLYATRAEAALVTANFPAAIAALEQVCRINPQNYAAGLTLARLTRFAGQPGVAEHVYQRLMSDLPEHRVKTARIWLPVLLSNRNYAEITALASGMIGEDPDQRAQWLEALLFSVRQRQSPALLARVLQENPHFPEWCTRLINLEIDLLEQRTDLAFAGLSEPLRPLPSDFAAAFQVDRLLRQQRHDEAFALLAAYGNQLSRTEAAFLRCEILQTQGRSGDGVAEGATLLGSAVTAELVARFSAHLLDHPSPEHCRLLYRALAQDGPALTAETLPVYNSLYLAAAVSGEKTSSDLLRAQLRTFTANEGRTLDQLARLIVAGKPDARLARILPLVPLPNEMTYRILQQELIP